ncbi:hypothetical protein MC885_016251, partial [Smutsia gigantea]
KGSGGLNLGNFFASRQGYSRKGFDRLSTEGSDQEKDEDDGNGSWQACAQSRVCGPGPTVVGDVHTGIYRQHFFPEQLNTKKEDIQ